ncbi:hypothetical protein [Oleiharenicola sp. Vm1]|uniref:hypothetical protein n=1 Tax=Oleiharenicola sp. Vm1 TaxID=3398393 RepID=UPI0039F5E07C
MKTLSLLLLCVWFGIAASFAAAPKKNSFVVAPPKDGRYVPWRKSEDSSRHYAGEIITLSGAGFRYQYFTDVIEEEVIVPDWSGGLKISPDHIYLDHPAVPFPYRITGLLDGVFVMTTWRAVEHWKKFGNMQDYDVLYLETKKAPNQAAQPTRGKAPRG